MRELVEYQNAALATAKYKPELGYLYTTLGLTGEAGEVAEKILARVFPDGRPFSQLEVAVFDALDDLVRAAKRCEFVKKLIRDCKDDLPPDQVSKLVQRVAKADRHGEPIALELGDTLWYLATMSNAIGYGLDEIAALNIKKLASRKARGALHGSGDDR